jgi:hypothetical protein
VPIYLPFLACTGAVQGTINILYAPQLRQYMTVQVIPPVPQLRQYMAVPVVPPVPQLRQYMAVPVIPPVPQLRQYMAVPVAHLFLS